MQCQIQKAPEGVVTETEYLLTIECIWPNRQVSKVVFVLFSSNLSAMPDTVAMFVRRIPLQATCEDARVLDGQSRICAWAFNQLKSLADDLRSGYARLKAAKRVEPERRHAGLEESANEIGRVLYTPRGLRNLLPELRKELSVSSFQ